MALDIMSNIYLDMKAPNTVMVYGVQYDSAGIIKAQLLNRGQKWTVPSGAKAVVSFKKSDNIGGFYDITEAGTAAIAYDTDRSIIYIDLDVQTLTTKGKVNMEVNFYQNGRRLSTFAFYLMVQEGSLNAGDVTSSAVFRILATEISEIVNVAGEIEEVIQEAEEAVSSVPTRVSNWLDNHITEGFVVDDSLTVEGAGADALIVGNSLRAGNFNQHIHVSPMVIGSRLGEWRSARATLTSFNTNGIKVARNSSSSTISYGMTTNVEDTGAANNANHKIYFKVSGANKSGATHFQNFRMVPYANGSTASGTINFDVDANGNYETIVQYSSNVDTFMFLLIPSTSPSNGEYFTVDYVQFIDLTDIFGAGLEPSISQFTKMFNDFPYNYCKFTNTYDRAMYQAYMSGPASICDEQTGRIKKLIQEVCETWTALKTIKFEKTKGTVEYLPIGDYQGLPYSSAIGFGGDIFYNRNINTFFSAIKNPASIIYQDNWAWGAAQLSNYGTVCTALSGWINSSPIFWFTEDLSNYNMFDWYDYNGPKSIKIGDCLLSPITNNTTHILVIFDIEVDRYDYQVQYIDLFEQAGSTRRDDAGWCRTRRLTVPEFENYLIENGGDYYLGRYKNSNIREIEPVRFALDVIPDMGDQTYYYANDDIYLYFPEVPQTLYYKRQNEVNYTTVNVSSLTTVIVNGTTVYEISELISEYDTYILTTNPDNFTQCKITRINVGTVSVSGANVTISGYSDNIEPVWTETQYVWLGEQASGRRPISYDGYAFAGLAGSKKLVNTDEFTTPVPSSQYGYQVRVYYETGFGQAFCDSEIIWQN